MILSLCGRCRLNALKQMSQASDDNDKMKTDNDSDSNAKSSDKMKTDDNDDNNNVAANVSTEALVSR